MKVTISAAVFLTMLASNALATGNHVPTPAPAPSSAANAVGIGHGGQGGQGGRATATGQGGEANSAANAAAEGGQASATATQSQTAEGGQATASNAGNAQSTTITSTYKERLQAPNVYAPAVYASGSCAYGWSAGISIPGGGISGGKAKPDPACDRREVARVLTPLNPALALKVLCNDPIVMAVANPEDCIYNKADDRLGDTYGAPAPQLDLSKYATKDEVERAFKKSVSK